MPASNQIGRDRFLWALTIALLLVATGASAIVPWTNNINTNNIIVVTNAAYGAKFDNSTDNALAISNAIVAAARAETRTACSAARWKFRRGRMCICAGQFTLNNVNLQIDAGAILRMLPFGRYPVTWFTNGNNVYFTANNFISGSSLTNIEISGSGAIDGQGLPWWPWANTNNAVRQA